MIDWLIDTCHIKAWQNKIYVCPDIIRCGKTIQQVKKYAELSIPNFPYFLINEPTVYKT